MSKHKDDKFSGVYAYAMQPPSNWEVPKWNPLDKKELDLDQNFDYMKLFEEAQNQAKFKKSKTKDVRINGERICKVCQQLEHDHHNFVPIQVPAGCVCPWEDWGDLDNIPEICEDFEAFRNEPETCKNCEHDKECHKGE